MRQRQQVSGTARGGRVRPGRGRNMEAAVHLQRREQTKKKAMHHRDKSWLVGQPREPEISTLTRTYHHEVQWHLTKENISGVLGSEST